MTEQRKEFTLKTLSDQVFRLANDLENLELDFTTQSKCSKRDRKSDEELIVKMTELLSKVYSFQATAAKNLYPTVILGEGPFVLTEICVVFSNLQDFLEDIIDEIREALDEKKDHEKSGNALPEDFRTPRQCLIDGFLIGGSRDWIYTSGLPGVLREYATVIAGMYFLENKEKEVTVHKLSETEENIIEALGKKVLRGEELAMKAGYPYNSNFKSTLSSLRKRGILGNKSPGYFLEPEYHFVLKKSNQGQD